MRAPAYPSIILLGMSLVSCMVLACETKGTSTGGADVPAGGGGAGADAGGAASSGGGAGTGGQGTGAAGGGTGTSGGEGGSGGSPQPGVPKIGAHAIAYYRYNQNAPSSISTPPLTTQPAGSTLIVSAGRGDFKAVTAPTDNKGNGSFGLLGQAHTYEYWPTSGTALYALTGAVGGANHVISNYNTPNDEITLAVVEVTGSSRVQDHKWVERLNSGQPVTSDAVTTTGRATLVAFWWGSGGAAEDKVAVPNNGFTVLDSVGVEGEIVQCFVAAKEVEAAGTYDVTWTSTPVQGAQLYLVAVE